MKMNPEEITAIIKDQIKNYNVDLNVDDVGTVIEIGDGIAHIHGLDKAMAGELLDFGNDIYGLVLNLEQDNVGAVILGGDTEIKEGATVEYAIVGENTVVEKGARIGARPETVENRDDWGIAVVGHKVTIAEGQVVGPKQMVPDIKKK